MIPATRHQPRLGEVLAAAARAYRARNDDAFRECLSEASALAPERLDLRSCLASHHIQTERPDKALDIYEELARLVPDDAGNLFRLAHWRRHAGDDAGAASARERLCRVNPGRAAELDRVRSVLDAWFSRPVTDKVPPFSGSPRRPAVLALGYLLAPDGSPEPELVARLEKTLEAAVRHPGALVVLSGGMPRSGRVEASVMREWLEGRGVAGGRICEEGYSRDVVENLVYSRQILALNRVDAVLIVTSACDVRRAGASLEIMAGACGDGWSVQAVAASGGEFADDGRDRLKAYRDALRAFGMPMMDAYPELAER